jgi:hypothetical protein
VAAVPAGGFEGNSGFSQPILKVSTVMSSENGLGVRPERRQSPGSKPTEQAKPAGEPQGPGEAPAGDALAEQLHRLYDSIAQEPIPDTLLDLLRKMKS